MCCVLYFAVTVIRPDKLSASVDPCRSSRNQLVLRASALKVPVLERLYKPTQEKRPSWKASITSYTSSAQHGTLNATKHLNLSDRKAHRKTFSGKYVYKAAQFVGF